MPFRRRGRPALGRLAAYIPIASLRTAGIRQRSGSFQPIRFLLYDRVRAYPSKHHRRHHAIQQSGAKRLCRVSEPGRARIDGGPNGRHQTVQGGWAQDLQDALPSGRHHLAGMQRGTASDRDERVEGSQLGLSNRLALEHASQFKYGFGGKAFRHHRGLVPIELGERL